MNQDELIRYLDQIEQSIRDIDGDEEVMKLQLIELADSIMTTLDDIHV